MSIWSLLGTSWIRSQKYSRSHARTVQQSRRFRPGQLHPLERVAQFEELEDRLVLSGSVGDTDQIYQVFSAHAPSPYSQTELTEKQDYYLAELFYVAPQIHAYELGGYLSEAASGEPVDIALDYLRDHASDFNLTARDVNGLILTDQYVSQHTGVTHLHFRQTYNDIEVVNADINVNLTAAGEIINVGSSLVTGLYSGSYDIEKDPSLNAVQAVSYLAAQFGFTLDGAPVVIESAVGGNQATLLTPSGISADEIEAELHYVPKEDGSLDLAWNIEINMIDGSDWFQASIGADDGLLDRFASYGSHFAQYNVYALPIEHPLDGERTIEVNSADPIASPFGWHDTDGIDGAEFTDTRGNNVFAQEDRDANNTGGFRPDGGADLIFDFDIDFDQEPEMYDSAAIVNLFYMNNISHDIHYQYGFDEAAGNFQQNNYGNGGIGGDPVQADAQDGSGTDNANFFTPPDGQAPRMQQYIFTYTTPFRDSDLSNSIIIHEYGHGVTNRLTGGASNSAALQDHQSRGMGEGWSDFWSLMFTQKTTDGQFDAYPVGNYVLGQNPVTGGGIRAYPYSFDMTIDPLTYGDLNPTTGTQHFNGTIWASALWDLNWLLINGDGGNIPAYGFDSDLYNGTGGNNIAMQLIMDGLKLQPANPSFLDARDAILLADQIAYGGANQLAIWTAFARRGMGFSADDGGSGDARIVTEAFDLPADSSGEVEFDAPYYEVGDTVTAIVRDIDLLGAGPITVQMTSSSGDSESVLLSEIGGGIFEASILTTGSSTVGDGFLGVFVGDTITVTYIDLDDGTGNTVIVTDTADIVEIVDIFVQDFESGLGSNEELVGGFTINNTNAPLNNGTLMVGHPFNYSNNEYSYYEVTLDLRGYENVSLEFEYAAWMEAHYDRFNIQASTSSISPPDDLIYPESGLPYEDEGDIHHPNLGRIAYDGGGFLDNGIAHFDLSQFDGQIATIRFQFGSDSSVTDPGINFDNIIVRGSVNEQPPTAITGGPYILGPRSSIRLDGSKSFDPNQPDNTLTYLWDYGADGQFDAVGVNPIFTTADLKGQASMRVRLTVIDREGNVDTDITRVFAEDLSRLDITGTSIGVVGQPRTIKLNLVGPATNQPDYEYTVNWGDGSAVERYTGPSGIKVSNVFNRTGDFTVTVTVRNRNTGLYSTDTHQFRIGKAQLQGDDFALTGTSGDDDIRIVTRPGQDRVELYLNRASLGVYTVPGTVYVFGLNGDDRLRADDGTYDVYWNGGNGNDVSYTYGGNDTLYGYTGDDRIYDYGGNNYINAGSGNNTVNSGPGNDRIFAGWGDDRITDTGGDNEISAGDGNNQIFTRRGNDYIVTGSGSDRVIDDGGHNYITVGDGSNVVRTGRGSDTILGGAQDDNIYADGEFDSGFFNYIMTFDGNDYIVAWGDNFIDSGLGNDFIFGSNLLDDEDDLFDILARVR